MSKELIIRYCDLVTQDTDSCLELFHPEAVLVTRIGSEAVEINKREKIRAFLDMVPSFLKYSLTEIIEEGPWSVAIVNIEGAHREAERFRFFFDDGLIRRLELVPDAKTLDED